MADLVETILKQIGPSPSSDVVSELVRRKGLKPAAARQRVSRAGENGGAKLGHGSGGIVLLRAA